MEVRFYDYIHRQIVPLILLSVFPGLGYLFLGWLGGVFRPALAWYLGILVMSGWGLLLHHAFRRRALARWEKERWYRQVLAYYYLFFLLWAVVFLLYAGETRAHLNYIAIFTQIGASAVASTFLYPEPRLYRPIIPGMMLLLVVYFALLGEGYGYVLSAFAFILGGVLLYGSERSFGLLLRTHRQAIHDLLTGLPNRQYFSSQLAQTLVDLKYMGGFSSLLLIDLDHFKTVNDSLGHEVGDGLLKEVARRLRSELPTGCHLARLGGDEFIIIGRRLPDRRTGEAKVVNLAQRLLRVLKQTYVVKGHHLYISASIGVRFFGAGEQDAGKLIREADIAMYEAKAAGRDGVFVFSEEVSEGVREHLRVERLLHFAIEQREISLVFQPIYDRDRRLVGAECLSRWRSREMGEVSPVLFIPIAEQTGLIIELGRHILEQAFVTLRRWHDRGVELEQFSVNISIRQCMHQRFVQDVTELCERYLTPELRERLVFEITETVIREEVNQVVAVMEKLRRLGIRFAMDDFGTGYSALGYLKRLPVDELKIDRTFVEDLDRDEQSRAMAAAILGIAGFLGLRVVAEGIENETQFEFLREKACDLYQGFHLSKPLDEASFLRLASGDEAVAREQLA